MASRKRYRLDEVAVEPGEVRRAKWTFAKGGRQAPVKGSEHLYSVTDGNLASRNKWEFLVRVPDAADGRVEIRPRTTPPIHTWKALTYRSLQFQKATKGEARGKRYGKVSLAVPTSGRAKDDPRGNRTKDVIRGDQRRDLPRWFEGLQGRMRTKERVRSTRGTDGNTLVVLVNPDDHAMMIRLYFAMKVWVLKEGIKLQ
ncbi:MAG: hypothetical protein H0T50_09720 [Gemmatimonadales bacterium]|nr:hypothetical protein [Gemmatimonadales bacterium]